jgi:signal transduction histidine kinase
VQPPLASEGVCLDHFVELVVRRADLVRQQCLKAEPVDEETLDWLLSVAPHAIQSLSNDANPSDAREGEKILELLLCLANLQDYIAHHSLSVKRTR